MDELEKAVEEAIAELGNWLTDNTDEVFEEQPEIDNIRTGLIDALERSRKARRA